VGVAAGVGALQCAPTGEAGRVADGSEGRRRRSVRLRGYDYAGCGAYFLTLCSLNREGVFGCVHDGAVRLSPVGRIVVEEWLRTPAVRPGVRLDAYVLMPNHLHAVVWMPPTIGSIVGAHSVGAHSSAPSLGPDPCGSVRAANTRPPRSLGSLVAGFKAMSTKRANEVLDSPGARLWQRNYHEHIVRDEADLARIRRYIEDNPAHWDLDMENPEPYPL